MLRLPIGARRRLEAWAIEGHPSERCGLLVGRVNESATTVCDVVLARNLDVGRAHDRYEVDPEDLMRADRRARAEGLDIVGCWHTHPDHPARPSETDRIHAWPGWSYVILSVTKRGVEALNSWRLDGKAFVEEEVQS